MTLIDKLESAVNNGIVTEPFTTDDIKTWINANNIINDKSGKSYENSYIEGFASSSVVGSSSTKSDKRLKKVSTNPEKYEFV